MQSETNNGSFCVKTNKNGSARLADVEDAAVIAKIIGDLGLEHPEQKPSNVLASLLGVTPTTIHNFVSGKSHPNLKQWATLAAAFPIAFQYINALLEREKQINETINNRRSR